MLRNAAALLPSGAVLLGLYGLHSAWGAILVYHLGILVFALLLRGRTLRPDPAREARAPTRTGRLAQAAPALVPLAAMAGPLLYLLWDAMVRPGLGLREWLAHWGLSGGSWALFVPYFGLVHPVLEQWFWRRIDEGLPTRPALTDVLFAGYHLLVLATLLRLPWLLVVFGLLLGTRLAWRWIYRSPRGRGVPLLSHAAADLSLVLAASLLVRAGR